MYPQFEIARRPAALAPGPLFHISHSSASTLHIQRIQQMQGKTKQFQKLSAIRSGRWNS